MQLRRASRKPSSLTAKSQTLRALYVCYLSSEDPLVHTQVVAYLEGLAERGHTIHLLTFDGRLDQCQRRSIEEDLHSRRITWHSVRYHKRPSLLATIFDTLVGAATVARLVRRHRLDTIHARNHVSAAMALIVCKVTSCRLIFDVRGLMASEYADAGRWKRGGLAFRLTELIQKAALKRADGIVMLTQALRRHLYIPEASQRTLFVIPCCTDLEQIGRWKGERETARAEIEAGDRPVMVYVGKFTGWYMEREMAEFFTVARRSLPGLLFLIVTQANPAPMLDELNRCKISPEDYRILRATPGELGRWLAACEFGVSFIRPCFSKISSSPTKIGEYLAAGLPVLSSAGIGDVDALLLSDRTGVLINEFSPPTYEAAAVAIRELCTEPGIRTRCHEAARKQLSLHDHGIPRYDELYKLIALSTATGQK